MEIPPFEFFRQEASHSDPVVRANAMSKVTIICAMIGAEKARNELIPFLRTKVGDLDQVLVVLSRKLGDFVPYIGGPEFAHSLISVLEPLCEIEEPSVRSVAANSVSKILTEIAPTYTTSVALFNEMFLRLANEESGELFYGRVSSAHFLPDLYRILSPADRIVVREIYNKFIADEMSMVRRGAAQSFIRFVEAVEPEIITSEMLQIMKVTAADEHPSVKVAAVENLTAFAAILNKIGAGVTVMSELIPVVKSSIDDPSWRVRLVMSKKVATLATSFSPSDVTSEMFPAVICMIQDAEPDVRVAALEGMTAFVPVVGGAHFLMEFIPVVVQLVDDPVSNCRKTLADVCVDIGSLVGPELVAQHISEVIVRIIGDEDPLVRLRVLKKLATIAEATPTLCARLTDSIKPMFRDTNWRVRKQLGVVLPSVTQFMGLEYLVDNFLADYLALLKDPVDEVREGTAASLSVLVTATNSNWVHEKIFPAIRSMATDDFLIRLTMLTALQGLLLLEIPERFQTEVLALAIGATNDKVPNIRLRAAQVLGLACASIGPENSRTRVRPVLAELLNDKDRDVKYFAAQSIKLCA